MITITHDLNSLGGENKIYVMKDGRVVQSGNIE